MSTVRETFGLACPHCRKDDGIIVLATEFVRLVPDGSVSASDQEWAIDSAARCTHCDHSGIVAEFDHQPKTTPAVLKSEPGGKVALSNDVLCELAHELTMRECGVRGITVDVQVDGNEDETRYTEDAQDVFNAIYDLVCGVLEPYCEEVLS